MIISKTPFRLSFMGGGTDLPSFYENEDGAVISTSFKKYMYLTVNDRFDVSFRLSYSKTEIVKEVREVQHPIIRTVLERHAKDSRGLEIISMADIPSGTGLGSSSSFTVGLVNAISGHFGQQHSAEALAKEACHIEINELKNPIGKQDQYAAAFGGLRVIRFFPDGSVTSEPVVFSPYKLKELQAHLVLIYTGESRDANTILKTQSQSTANKIEVLREMKKRVFVLQEIMQNNGSIETFGKVMHEGWELKRSLVSGISNDKIGELYNRGLEAGAYGGKLLGAGGGGFLMFVVPPNKRNNLLNELSDHMHLNVEFDPLGSRVIFYDPS